MSDDQTTSGPTAESWAAFQKIWGETFTKLMQLGFTVSPESAPPEFISQMRSGLFHALGQSWDQFLRSPQFLDGMKQWMDNAIAFRKLSNDFFTKARQGTQSTTREDIDSVMLALRHLETRVLDRVEALVAQVDALDRRVDGAKPKRPAPRSKAAARRRRLKGRPKK